VIQVGGKQITLRIVGENDSGRNDFWGQSGLRKGSKVRASIEARSIGWRALAQTGKGVEKI